MAACAHCVGRRKEYLSLPEAPDVKLKAKHRAILGWSAGGLVIAALAGFGIARYMTAASHAAADEPEIAAAALAVPEAPAGPAVGADPLPRLTIALNEVRGRQGLGELAWSETLSKAADASARTIASTACTAGAAERAGRDAGGAVFWAAALPRLDGGDSAQDIAPGYLVSQWRAGQHAVDANGKCRDQSSACEAWMKLSSPDAAAVGCARSVCASNAQVWICRFGN